VSRDAAGLLALSLLALGAAWLAGVRFLAGDLDTAWHLLDPELLRHDLLRSLFYLHSQPPLLNFVVGVALKLGPAPQILTALWSACAIASAQCTRLFALEVGASRWPALAAGGLVAIAPSTLLYVHHVGPEMATAAALIASALCLARGRHWAGFALLGAACLLRSLLAPPVVLLVLAVVGRRAWKPALAVFAALVLLSAKNFFVCGVFSTSSWMGMNLAHVTAVQLPRAQQRPMPYPFSPLIAVEGHSGVPALDEVRKPGGAINYNNLAYAQASRAMLREDLRAVGIAPGAVARAMAQAWLLFFWPADQWAFIRANRVRIARWADFWDEVLCAHVRLPGTLLGIGDLFPTILLGMPLLLGAAARDRRTWTALVLVLAVAALGNFFEVGENYRFRFLAGPLCAALAAAGWPGRRR
jgi:hypothetical protein